MKVCIDKLCRRAGVTLWAKEFPKNRTRDDGLHVYCRECSIRRAHEYRSRKRAVKLAQKTARKESQLKLAAAMPRKPNITAADRVRLAVERGAKNIESIQRATKLSYDLLGDLLVEMVWETKTIRIERSPEGRQFIAA